ncbi:Predicted ATP-dependent protease [Enterobacter asburiae]|uniref:Predicted ATP-dependent protease n=1 Tax=Enterobacter asburiae TaxID=61645 RepID=A0A376F8D1_ENTAS|nr:Predicted ATP-dependent protease [Enterobacter asburiae]
MAELCALISALAEVPINQNIAITGSVDQFGRAQPVGGLNEKIEGFFSICQQRGLNGKQGVIIPAPNARHLSLSQDILDAVEQEQFAIWAIEGIEDALPLLTNLVWDGEGANYPDADYPGAHSSGDTAGCSPSLSMAVTLAGLV